MHNNKIFLLQDYETMLTFILFFGSFHLNVFANIVSLYKGNSHESNSYNYPVNNKEYNPHNLTIPKKDYGGSIIRKDAICEEFIQYKHCLDHDVRKRLGYQCRIVYIACTKVCLHLRISHYDYYSIFSFRPNFLFVCIWPI